MDYSWSQESGPSTATLTGEDTPDLTASNLVEGTYVFRLTVTDNEGLQGSDLVNVNVIPGAASIPLYLNSGGPDFNFEGQDWIADNYSVGGTAFTNSIAIAGTTNDQLYQSERYADGLTSFSYEIPVQNGSFDIHLHFAEIFHGVPGPGAGGGPGSRIFNVNIENGQAQLTNYDIIVEAGGSATAVVESFSGIDVSDGFLNIVFTSVVGDSKISGIEVLSTGAPIANAGPDKNIILPTSNVILNGSGNDPDGGTIVSYEWTQVSGPAQATLLGENTATLTASNLVLGTYVFRLTVTDDEDNTGSDEVSVNVHSEPELIRINSGGPAFSFGGLDWMADAYSTGGDVFSNPIAIANTANDELYQTERFDTLGALVYELPVNGGVYDLNLHFAEIYFGVPGPGSSGGPGSRVFNIDIENGQYQINNYDIIVAAGGSATAVIESFDNISVSDGFLTITLTSVVEFAKLSGIELFGTQQPVADAGEDQNLQFPANSVTLNGSAFDPDGGNITAYQWSQVSGPSTATLTGATTPDLTASEMIVGSYIFRLTVTDDENDTGFDDVVVNVLSDNEPPIADAGEDQEITLPNNSIVLNGSGTDPDGGSITAYLWTQVSGPNTASLSGEDTPDLTASDLIEGEYVFRLTVTDDENDTGSDDVTVTVNADGMPTAVAEATPLNGDPPLEVSFTGSNSTDDVGITSYFWDFMDGNTSTEADPVHIFTTEGTFNVELTVTDGDNQSDTAVVSIVVGDSSNLPPVANIQADPESGTVPLEVNFTGRNSTDDFGIDTFSWDFGDGFTSELTDPIHTFTDPGQYNVVLTVTDTGGLSNSASVTIVVNDVSDEEFVAILLENPAIEGVARIRILNQPRDIIAMNFNLFDATGRLMATYDAQDIWVIGDWYEIPIANLRNGMYYIGMNMNKGDTLAIKLLVNN